MFFFALRVNLFAFVLFSNELGSKPECLPVVDNKVFNLGICWLGAKYMARNVIGVAVLRFNDAHPEGVFKAYGQLAGIHANQYSAFTRQREHADGYAGG